ncbi:7235_t:CDS:2 [Entrophospora sp. SA101]|nr:7235_t:CDS:2 [Entrophospora sp. SA101]CAJ0912361.1 9552_t:CDS:2 [Entrophospora sp. SA101]
MNSLDQIDELVKEYLMFRGFTNAIRAFEMEIKNDKGFEAEKIVDELYTYVTSSDINGLMDNWKYLNLRYFSRLDSRFFASVKKFELTTQQKRKDKVLEFFEILGAELNENNEWAKWFGLPFSKNPESDPNFKTFFTRQWLDTFTISLNNFLNTIFQHMRILNITLYKSNRKALQNEIDTLKNVITNLKSQVESGDLEISTLRQKISQSLSSNTKTRRRAISLFESKENKDNKINDLPKLSITEDDYDEIGVEDAHNHTTG